MNSITTHVLDTSRGRPAAGVPVTLEFQVSEQEWTRVGEGATDEDGRLRTLLASDVRLNAGNYRLTFDLESRKPSFYPSVVIVFRVDNPDEHYHVPLLLGPFSYTTYRGS